MTNNVWELENKTQGISFLKKDKQEQSVAVLM